MAKGDLPRQDGWTSAGHCVQAACGRPRQARGLCDHHYKRWLTTGEGPALPAWRDFTAAEWFWMHVDQSGGMFACWPWTGYTMASGYGRNRHGYTHRYALELALGRPLADGMESCHTCDNPPCCNPAHLFEGTRLDNERDKTAKGRRNTRKAA